MSRRKEKAIFLRLDPQDERHSRVIQYLENRGNATYADLVVEAIIQHLDGLQREDDLQEIRQIVHEAVSSAFQENLPQLTANFSAPAGLPPGAPLVPQEDSNVTGKADLKKAKDFMAGFGFRK